MKNCYLFTAGCIHPHTKLGMNVPKGVWKRNPWSRIHTVLLPSSPRCQEARQSKEWMPLRFFSKCICSNNFQRDKMLGAKQQLQWEFSEYSTEMEEQSCLRGKVLASCSTRWMVEWWQCLGYLSLVELHTLSRIWWMCRCWANPQSVWVWSLEWGTHPSP